MRHPAPVKDKSLKKNNPINLFSLQQAGNPWAVPSGQNQPQARSMLGSLAAESTKGFTERSGILIRPIRSREIDHIAIQLANSIPIR
jgi:hypothetical protein